MKIYPNNDKLILVSEGVFEIAYMSALTGIDPLLPESKAVAEISFDDGKFYVKPVKKEKPVTILNATGIPHPVTRSKSSYHKWESEDVEILRREYPKNTTLASLRKMLNQGIKGRFSHSAIAAKARSLGITRTRSKTPGLPVIPKDPSPSVDPDVRKGVKTKYVRWSRNDEEILQRLWTANSPIAEIQQSLPTKYDRQAIWGKVRRMGLERIKDPGQQVLKNLGAKVEKESITV